MRFKQRRLTGAKEKWEKANELRQVTTSQLKLWMMVIGMKDVAVISQHPSTPSSLTLEP